MPDQHSIPSQQASPCHVLVHLLFADLHRRSVCLYILQQVSRSGHPEQLQGQGWQAQSGSLSWTPEQRFRRLDSGRGSRILALLAKRLPLLLRSCVLLPGNISQSKASKHFFSVNLLAVNGFPSSLLSLRIFFPWKNVILESIEVKLVCLTSAIVVILVVETGKSSFSNPIY